MHIPYQLATMEPLLHSSYSSRNPADVSTAAGVHCISSGYCLAVRLATSAFDYLSHHRNISHQYHVVCGPSMNRLSVVLQSSPPLLTFHSLIASQAESRYRELSGMGLNVNLVLVGNKGRQYFTRRPQYKIASECVTWLPSTLIPRL